MRKSAFVAMAALVLCASCGKDIDFSKPMPTAEEINANVEKVFGVTFDPNQDWCTTQNGKVTISINNDELRDVEKVQILTVSPFGNSDANGAKSLNESSVSYGQSVTLYYDAPKMYNRLYAACVTKSGKYFVKGFNVGEQNVVFTPNTVSAGARTRSAADNFDLKDLVKSLPVPTIVDSCSSFGAQRAKINKPNWDGWQNEKLYQWGVDGDVSLRLTIDDYTTDYKKDLYDMIFNNYLQNKVDNIDKIKNSEYYLSNNNYPLTTGNDPIIMAPVSKNDSIYHEIENCDLYYYYFKDATLKAMNSDAERIQYLKDLPKYRALELWNSINDAKNAFTMKNNEIKRQSAYALIYWGDGTPEVGITTGQYIFPEGYKIGFMIRSIDTKQNPNKDGDKRDGELYCDGRLNTAINLHGHFKSAGLHEEDPRMAWFWANDRNYLCCESGSDKDINDIVFEVLGGLMVPPPPVIDQNKYTFCFEDTPLGDYDLNDVVIRAYRKDKTHVVYQVVACGAYDRLFIKNINGRVINESTEVHEMFGKPGKQFINTEKIVPETDWIEETVEVAENFSFLNTDTQPYIYDETTGVTVKIAMAGQDPHAIMVPYEFRYPLEKVLVSRAYPKFNSWGTGAVITDEGFKWYLFLDETLVTQAIPTLVVPYQSR